MPSSDVDSALQPLHEPVLVRWPDTIELAGYCDADCVTTDLVATVVGIVERAIDEPITHAIRNLLPQPIKIDIADEVERGWRSAKRSLRLSNSLSSANHVELTIDRRSRRSMRPGRPIDYGHVSVKLRNSAPALAAMVAALPQLVTACDIRFARMGAPGLDAGDASLPSTFVFRLSESWQIREALGWVNYWSDETCRALGFPQRFADILPAEHVQRCGDRGYLVRLGETPFTLTQSNHTDSYRRVTALLPSASETQTGIYANA